MPVPGRQECRWNRITHAALGESRKGGEKEKEGVLKNVWCKMTELHQKPGHFYFIHLISTLTVPAPSLHNSSQLDI